MHLCLRCSLVSLMRSRASQAGNCTGTQARSHPLTLASAPAAAAAAAGFFECMDGSCRPCLVWGHPAHRPGHIGILFAEGRVRDKAQPGLRGAGGQCDGWATRLHERTRLRQFKPGVCCRLCVGSERGQNDGLPRAAGSLFFLPQGDLAPCVPTHDGPQEPAIHRAALHAACARSQGCAPSPRLPCAGARPVPGLQPLRTGGRARAVPRRCFRARA
mmetsp:Transcript_4243/g.11469  ORF Transcript_4243/g.11469 Transcript_4243/m.11469 type:complete len:216 (+) Transcript_4243:1134-1781(+)